MGQHLNWMPEIGRRIQDVPKPKRVQASIPGSKQKQNRVKLSKADRFNPKRSFCYPPMMNIARVQKSISC